MALTTRTVRVPTAADLRDAAVAVRACLPPTPLVDLPLPGTDRTVLAKLETLQPTGSFKVRGALAALAAYASTGRPVVAASAGNHGLAVAFAAARARVSATIVVPRTASPAKFAALRELGSELVSYGEGYDQAERHALDLAAQRGAVFVSPYNDPHVIAGQATCATEITDQLTGDYSVVVPVGSGGLLAGTVLALPADAGTSVVGVEAQASRAVSSSVAAGRVVTVPIGPTLADGLAGNLEAGSVTPGLVAGAVRSFVPVTEDEITTAIRYLALRCGLVVEGSGAVGVAALMAGKVSAVASTAVVVLTGRNIAGPTFAAIVGGQLG